MSKQLFQYTFLCTILTLLICHTPFASIKSFNDKDCPKQVAHSYYAFSMAKIYFNHKMYEKAEEMLREAVIIDDCSASLYSESADLLLKMGKEKEAEYFSEKSLEIDPGNIMALKVQALLKGTQSLMLKDEELLNESLNLGYKYLEKDSNDSRIYVLLVKLNFEKGDVEQAAQILGDYFSKFQRNLDPVFLAADIIKESEKSAHIDRFFNAFLSQGSINAKTILVIGNLLENGGYLTAAQRLYHEASLKYRDNDLRAKDAFALYEMGNYEESIEVMEKMEDSLSEEHSILRTLANAYWKVGRMKRAIEIYQKLFRKNPEDSSLASEIGEFYRSIGDIKNAISYFKLALELLQDSTPQANRITPRISLYFRIILLLISEEEYSKAGKVLLESKKHGSDKEANYYILSSRMEEHDSLRKALKIIKKAKNLFPSHVGLLLREAELYLEIDKQKVEDLLKSILQLSNHSKRQYLYISRMLRGAHQFEMAKKLLREALMLYPDSDVFLEMGALMEQWKQYQEAETFLKKSIEQDPTNAIALNYLGYMLAEQSERFQEALSYVQRALELDRYNGAYIDSLGFIYLKLGKLELAEKNILIAAEIFPFDPEIRDHLGDLYYALGNTKKAIIEWKSAIQFNIESPQRVKSKIISAESSSPSYGE